MLVDLHNHTYKSHDGFSTDKQIISACKKKGINAIAITEHDVSCRSNSKLYKENNIELIKGCEFTTNNGAHIIGLFISDSNLLDNSREGIIKHIKNEGGIIIMPHPWKKDSGYMAKYCEDDFLHNFDFIEMINGGWNSKEFENDILKIAKKYDIKMVSSSDSHKCSHVGLCATRIISCKEFSVGQAKEILRLSKQHDFELLIDFSSLKLHGRKTLRFQKTNAYQFLLKFVPKLLRRYIKLAKYYISNEKYSHKADYTIFKLPQ